MPFSPPLSHKMNPPCDKPLAPELQTIAGSQACVTGTSAGGSSAKSRWLSTAPCAGAQQTAGVPSILGNNQKSLATAKTKWPTSVFASLKSGEHVCRVARWKPRVPKLRYDLSYAFTSAQLPHLGLLLELRVQVELRLVELLHHVEDTLMLSCTESNRESAAAEPGACCRKPF